MLRRECHALCLQLPGAGARQTQAENSTTMGIDAVGKFRHPGLCVFTQVFQNAKRMPVTTCLCHAGKIAAQGKQAAHKRLCVHIGMASAVTKRDQTRFGLQRSFCVERTHRGEPQCLCICSHGAAYSGRFGSRSHTALQGNASAVMDTSCGAQAPNFCTSARVASRMSWRSFRARPARCALSPAVATPARRRLAPWEDNFTIQPPLKLYFSQQRLYPTRRLKIRHRQAQVKV